jgi:hypothetical protein
MRLFRVRSKSIGIAGIQEAGRRYRLRAIEVRAESERPEGQSLGLSAITARHERQKARVS